MKEDLLNTEEASQQNHGFEEEKEQDPGVEQETKSEPEEKMGYEQPYGSGSKKLRIPIWIIAFSMIVIVLDLFSMLGFPKLIKEYKDYKLAEQRIAESDTSQALNDLYAVAEKHTNSMPVLVKLVRLSMDNGYYDMAGYVIDNYIAGKGLSDSEYNTIDGYYTKLENYYAAYDAVDQIFNEVNTDLSPVEQNDEIREKLKAILHQDGMDDAYISYYLGYVAENNQDGIAFMKDCYEIDPECMDVRTQLSIMYRRAGDFISARTFGEESLGKDKKDSGALRSMAILELLEKNQKQGLQYAKEAYTYDPDGTYIRETYLIALSINNETEEAERIKTEMTSGGGSLDPDTEQLLKGELTLEQYYVGQ